MKDEFEYEYEFQDAVQCVFSKLNNKIEYEIDDDLLTKKIDDFSNSIVGRFFNIRWTVKEKCEEECRKN